MRRLLPQSLAGRLVLLLLLALVATQGISLAVFYGERRHAVRAVERAQVLVRTASTARLLADVPPALGGRVVAAASGPRLRFSLAEESAVDPAHAERRDSRLGARLARLLEGAGVTEARVRLEAGEATGLFAPMWRRHRHHHDEGEDDDHGGRHRGLRALTIAVHLGDGRWLNAETVLPPPLPGWARASVLSLAAMAAVVAFVVVLSVRRITRPLRALALAADGVGRGEATPPLAEEGPEEVRRTVRAFNRMRGRIERFVEDRTRMLAAVSHDLRTPITTLRLRAEFVDDAETRERLVATLDEMQAMIEAVLAFAREDAAREDTRRVDLAALVASLCDDLADQGGDVAFAEAGKTTLACRPVALKRALGNLIENALAYGRRARVSLIDGAEAVEIVVEDDGPGIPEAEMARVFEPFVRLDRARGHETGGVGLGLAIARTVARAHGGDVVLANRPEGGLRASLRLPKRAV